MSRAARAWQAMTTREAARVRERDGVAVLPLAAVEQHGPHLPLDTDVVIGDGLLDEAFRALPLDFPAWVLPMLPVGASGEHAAFAGTLSVEPETLVAWITGIGRAVAAAGVHRLVLSNSHGGNRAAMDMAALRLRRECGLLVVKAEHFRFPPPDPPAFPVDEMRHGLHGGAVETAMMLHLAPGRVRRDAVPDAPPLGARMAPLYRYLAPEGPGAFAWLAGDLHPLGVAGNAGLADAATGARLVAHYGGVLAAVIREARRFPLGDLAGS